MTNIRLTICEHLEDTFKLCPALGTPLVLRRETDEERVYSCGHFHIAIAVVKCGLSEDCDHIPEVE